MKIPESSGLSVPSNIQSSSSSVPGPSPCRHAVEILQASLDVLNTGGVPGTSLNASLDADINDRSWLAPAVFVYSSAPQNIIRLSWAGYSFAW